MASQSIQRRGSAANTVLRTVRRGGERFWRHTDFSALPPAAVSQTLSRLARQGEIQRVRKGLYYRSRSTVLGASSPAPDAVVAKSGGARLYPAGITAANRLGFTTQNPALPEYVSSASTVTWALAGALVRTRRPANRGSLSDDECALLEFLRDRGSTSDLDDHATCRRLLELLNDEQSFARLAKAALAEPPRVRAMLGAAGEELAMSERWLRPLRRSLNPLSRFEFGRLACLQYARQWQAK